MAAAGVLACSAATIVPATAQAPSRQPLTLGQCSEQAAQVNGPDTTAVNAQAGNGRITVGLDSAGTITDFKYPNPSYYNQVKYFTTGPDPATGQPGGELPNEGSFAGLLYTTVQNGSSATVMQWLKQPDLGQAGWTVTQSYASSETPVVVTTYSNPNLKLTVTVTDLANAAPLEPGDASAPAAFVRQITVQLGSGSPVEAGGVDLVYYEHFDALGSRYRYFPVQDSCFQQFDDSQTGTYVAPASDGSGDAIVQSWQGIDQADNQPSSVAFAFGFDQNSAQHQLGVDGTDPLAPPLSSLDSSLTDGYTEMTNPPHQLSGSDAAAGQVTGTLVTRALAFNNGTDSVRLIIGAGKDPEQAMSALQTERASTWSAELGAVDGYWQGPQGWLAKAPLPQVPSTSQQYSEAARIDSVAQRALISIRLAVDPDSGAIVASADTQGPYGEDWMRDGSFINAALDEAGYQSLVTSHNLFEAAAQSSPTNLDPAAPSGNWPMNVYGDGLPGGPIPYEIDETGFGAWTLYQHYSYLSGSLATAYLEEVFPAIARAADWLTTCKDPVDGLQCEASEDDSVTPSQTLHGAGPDLLGLNSAVSAAQALLAADPTNPAAPLWAQEKSIWQARATELQGAIDALYNADTNADGLYAETSPKEAALTGASTVPTAYQVFTDGGWLLWPVGLHPASDQRMQAEAGAVLNGAMVSLGNTTAGYTGSYEAKGLLGVCQAYSQLPGGVPSSDLGLIQEAVGMLSAASAPGTRGFTTSTGLFAEAWKNYSIDGTTTQAIPLNDEPHVWEGALYYMTAMCAFPATS